VVGIKMCFQHPVEVKGEGNGGIGQVAYKGNMYSANYNHYFPALHVLFLSSVNILLLFADTICIFSIYPQDNDTGCTTSLYLLYCAIQSFTERNSL
jgi:hypothetical protein